MTRSVLRLLLKTPNINITGGILTIAVVEAVGHIVEEDIVDSGHKEVLINS